MQTISAIQIAHLVLQEKLKTARCIIDATVGNGHDTVFLARHAASVAVIYGFDVQAASIVNARFKLDALNLPLSVNLINDSHAELDKYVDGMIDVAVFNLGYLPGGDHELTTVAASTLMAVNKVLERLMVNGLLVIVAYRGHAAGLDEYRQLSSRLDLLPASKYTVARYEMINHNEKSPVLFLVEQVRR